MAGEERQPRSQQDRVELPSIRQAVPEIINSRVSVQTTASEYRGDGCSPTGSGVSNTPVYVHSPSLPKRRRLSSEEEQDFEFRERTGRKRHRSPSGSIQRAESITISPTSSTRHASTLPSTESWTSSGRSSPYLQSRGHTAARSPRYDGNATFEPPSMNRSDWRPTLPSLPALTLDRGPPQVPPVRNSVSEYALDSSRSGAQTYPQAQSSAFGPPISSYQQPATSYGYQQPRGQSFSGPSHDRTPFSNSQHAMYGGSGFPYGMGDPGPDSKQRKRRGNLPKETTDKLRAWFVAHLQHPYPTEDEKQDLMRQTGLQINQISNWFINARRRQLPAMINNARAESDARSARGSDGNLLTEIADYGDDKPSGPLGESEEDGEGYDDEYDGLRSRHALQGNTKRGSL
ncbi:Homeobox protein homothorax [Lachnellula occidentalis]|uniref:Homeobox protein homothorax n=1 Tax=Lachnellula occidentalis TaxID=215460 RepID=A0A8H8UHL3_9HELO|nr:Homeobox protein homothorax [Lachnellula occidentalis]